LAIEIDFIFLLKAIKDRKPLDIQFRERNKLWNYISRFLKLNGEHQSITIDLPYTPIDTYRPLEKDNKIQVAFNMAGFRFKFDSIVSGKGEYHISEKIKTPSLVIAWPANIKDSNRRSLYRIRVSIRDPVTLQITSTRKKQKDSVSLSVTHSVTAIIIDISKNGMAIETSKHNQPEIGDKLNMHFNLENQRDGISIQGIVVYTTVIKEKGTVLCGLQFVSSQSKNYAKSLKQIIIYAMARNHEQIDFFAVKQMVSKNTLVNKIVDGEVTDELLKMLINQEFPLNEQEYLESLVHILHYPEYKEDALKTLQQISHATKFEYVQRVNANHRVVYHVASEALTEENLKMVQAVLSNQFLPIEFTLKIAKEGNDIMIHNMLAQKEKLVIYPEIMEVLKKNPNLSSEMTNKAILLQHEMLLGLMSKPISATTIIEDLMREVQEKKRGEKAPPKNIKEDQLKKETLSLLTEINKMSIQERIKLALIGNRKERMILARDPNRFVIMALVESSKIGIEEILVLFKNENLDGPTITKMMQNPQWTEEPQVIFACMKNPKTPVNVATPIIDKLKAKDITAIINDNNVNPTIKNQIRSHHQNKKMDEGAKT